MDKPYRFSIPLDTDRELSEYAECKVQVELRPCRQTSDKVRSLGKRRKIFGPIQMVDIRYLANNPKPAIIALDNISDTPREITMLLR
jgi:hypothetical protein